jgi:hypothetical protein
MELAENPQFMNNYMAALFLPHTDYGAVSNRANQAGRASGKACGCFKNPGIEARGRQRLGPIALHLKNEVVYVNP